MRILLPLLTGCLLLATACGSFTRLDRQQGEDAGTTDAGNHDAGTTTTDGGAVDCTGRDFCSCWQEPACQFVSESCLCPCDYQCPGEDPCMCGCGGGEYLGCVAATCPGVNCGVGEVLELDADGCGVCVPEDCTALGFCDCDAVQHCAPVTNIGFCECGTGCDPNEPICDCAAPPFEPSYAGCAEVACPDPGCDTSTQMFLVGSDGCPVCAPIPTP